MAVPASREWEAQQPPYGLTQAFGSASGLVLLGATFAVTGPFEWWRACLIFSFGSWIGRFDCVRWWQCRHGYRSLSWVPASAFAAVSVLIGFAVAVTVEPTSARDREHAIALSLAVAWLAGDTLDWALQRVHARRMPAAGR